MASAEDFSKVIKEWELATPQPPLKAFLKARFPDLTQEALRQLIDNWKTSS